MLTGIKKNSGELKIYHLDPSQLPSLFRPYCDVPPSPSLEVESGYVFGRPSLHIHTYKCAVHRWWSETAAVPQQEQ